MKLELPAEIHGPQDLQAVTLELHRLSVWYRHQAVKRSVSKRSRSNEAPELTDGARKLMRARFSAKAPTAAGLEVLVSDLEKLAKSAPRVSVTLAAAPSEGLKETIVAWYRANIGQNVLVSFSFNAAILGGMVVRTGSRIFDWSLRRDILTSRGRFAEVLRRV